MEANSGNCPVCGSELSRVKFAEIEERRKYEEKRSREKMEAAELALKRRLELEHKKEIDQVRQDAAKRASEQAEKEIKKVVAESELLARKVKESERREVEIRKQAAAEIEKQKIAAANKAAQAAAAQIAKVTAERDAAATKLRESQESEAETRKQIQDEADKRKQKELLQQREVLEKDKTLALLKLESEFSRERESYRKKNQLLHTQLARRTANELGDGGEIDVFEALREAFDGSGGKTTRIPKGQPGADIVHDVFHRGQRCGRIVVDAKVRQGWQNNFVTKLRQDQVEAGAEHAILATTVFPAGKKEMCIESGVIVMSPARVVHMVQVLRQAIISMHIKGLTMNERTSKMTRLYKLITSDAYTGKLAEASKLTQDILELEVQEQTAHGNVWRKRGSLMKRMQSVLREVDTEVAAVVEGDSDDDQSDAFNVTAAPGSANGGNLAWNKQ